MPFEVVFSRTASVADRIAGLVEQSTRRLDAALYRFNNPQLAEALQQFAGRGGRVRLIVDRGKHDSDAATRQLLDRSTISCRVLSGRRGSESKMHHKFAILDNRIVLTGSYNWTMESQEANFENLVILSDPAMASQYEREFEVLWEQAEKRS